MESKINLIKRIKGFKWITSTKTSITLYKSFIRSIFDYCHVITSSSTQKIIPELQKLQNKILRIIKYFPIKTSIVNMHKCLNIEMLEQRLENLFLSFTQKKKSNNILIDEVKQFLNHNPPTSRFSNRFTTPFEKWNKIQMLEPVIA
ncbi:RNA-directed DNA polymerase from mobile element jockey-like [Brachionus plicatilis]|uniref:RNA-directed DNA polymerase from mobile element jockey-like n=1 Tax=Brachionus plicatilis TaxID=10195 RepID=A0A3M7T1U7_BRAPC|nr:RNA-directed DNA polymerase from mobile element jockey-like [Brachionus plicatilis]